MSTTDLYGKPLNAPAEFLLNKWQKRQATLLYHFASLNYLKGLKKLLDDFVTGVDITLDAASWRDEFLVSERWGVRNTVANFNTYGFAALEDFKKATNKDIARRASESYEFTGYNQCARLLGELSMVWSTHEEQERFEAGMQVIGEYATVLDSTMQHTWKDSNFHSLWIKYGKVFGNLPKFRVRTDVEAESGKMPVRTGVYVPQDDPCGSLQFAWTGNNDGRLFDCSTLNDLGLQAINTVGRDALWTNDSRLLPIVKQPQYLAAFKKQRNPILGDEKTFLNDPEEAMVFVSVEGTTKRPCKWYFVEMVNGEFENAADDEAEQAPKTERIRVQSGQSCPQTGYYFTPAQSNSRRQFNQGEVMPGVGGDYGVTIWQWDEQQS
jgi:hypothetical protein